MAFRLNIRTLKSLSWLAVVLALAWAGLIFFDIYEGKNKEGRYASRPRSEIGEILQRDTADARDFRDSRNTYTTEDQQKAWLARTDGSVKPPPPKPVDPTTKNDTPVVKALEKLETVLKISMVVWSNNEPSRFVAVRYTDDAKPASVNSKAKRLHLSPGDPLRSPYDEAPYEGKVLSIDRQAVTFSWGGEEVTLTPPLGRAGDGPLIGQVEFGEREDVLAEFNGQRPKETRTLDGGALIIGTNDIATFKENGPEIFQSLGIRSVTPKNGRTMLELSEVPNNSLIKSYGFQTGDQIISVNGIPMSSKSSAWNWYEQNPDLPRYEVKYLSAGQEKSKVIHNPQDG
ncbi:MAG: hypothetical protein DHS20C15_22320 [Planctomycetota bacterium]|nr:MAG: hypothetical protein DHS20C15_22320 [Planctomycetota bacterium]